MYSLTFLPHPRSHPSFGVRISFLGVWFEEFDIIIYSHFRPRHECRAFQLLELAMQFFSRSLF